MDWWLITFFLGAIISLLLPIVPAFFYVFLFLLCFLLALSNKATRRYSAVFLGCGWLLFIASAYQHVWRTNNIDKAVFFNQPAFVTGHITTIPHCENNRCRFNFSATLLNNEQLAQQINIRLNWEAPAIPLKQDQQWQLWVKIKPAHGLANAGGFSYQTWLRRSNIHATGYVKNRTKKSANKATNKVIKQKNRLLDDVVSLRHQQFLAFSATLPPHYLTPLIQTLTFGVRNGLTKSHWRVLQRTQIQHLIAISGLHIGIVAGGSYFLFLFILSIVPFSRLFNGLIFNQKRYHDARRKTFRTDLLTHTNSRIVALIFSAVCAGFYAYLAGFSVPTLRALIMIYWFLLFRLLAVKVSVKTWLSLSVFCIVLLMPMSLLSMSFWLSFYAVVSIFIILWRFHRYFAYADQARLASQTISTKQAKYSLLSYIVLKSRQLLILQIALTVVMLPLATLLSGQLSLVSILANIVAVPLVSFVVLPLSIIALLANTVSPVIAAFIVDVTLWVLSWLWQYLTLLADVPWATITLSQLQWRLVCLAVFIVLLGFIVAHSMRKWLIVPLTLAVLTIGALHNNKADSWQVKVMDVGQGLAVIVQQNNRILLYDTGASYPSGFSMAESVLLPYFQQQGVTELDWLIVSHDDNDHAGGLSLLNERVTINNLMTNDLAIKAEHRCLAGQTYRWQLLTIELLSPNVVKGDDNDDSCVVRISDGSHSVLLAGDISQKIERQIIASAERSSTLKADILIAPHHGSKTSSSAAFINAVSPSYAVFSAGFLNHWRMPATEVVERYHRLNVKTFNTAENGMITLDINRNKIHVKRYRNDNWPYWFAN